MNRSPPTTVFNASSINAAQSRAINLNTSDFITPQSQAPFYVMTPQDTLVDHNNARLLLACESDLELRRLTNELANFIRQSNLKLIAFDFDQTIVSVHTSGFWRDSAERLAEYVRPAFQYLIPELLKNDNLCIAIVTYSPQLDLIKDVLRLSMKLSG